LQTVIHPEKSFEDFNKVLEDVHYLISRYGIDKFTPSGKDSLERIKFMVLVHEGWKKAQNLVIAEILAMQDELLIINKKIKRYNKNRRRKQANDLKKATKLINSRINKLKKSIDAIIWQIFSHEDHLLKRLFLNDSIDNINRATLRQTLEFTDVENKKPSSLAICCDLSTFVHVGDVLLLDLSEDKLALIELKEGERNLKLHDVLTQFYQTGCERNLFYNTRDFGEKDFKQLDRMAKQQWRMSQFKKVAEDGEGIDISSNKKVNVPDERTIVDGYETEIIRMYEDLEKGKNWAIATIDGCLHLGLYKDHRLAFGFEAWMSELAIDSKKIDYLNVFSIPLACPPFAQMLPDDLILKLSTEKYKLLLCLDIPTWIKKTNEANIFPGELVFETPKKSRKLKMESRELVDYKGKLIKYVEGDTEGYVGYGILMKIFFRHYEPISALRAFNAK